MGGGEGDFVTEKSPWLKWGKGSDPTGRALIS